MLTCLSIKSIQRSDTRNMGETGSMVSVGVSQSRAIKEVRTPVRRGMARSRSLSLALESAGILAIIAGNLLVLVSQFFRPRS